MTGDTGGADASAAGHAKLQAALPPGNAYAAQWLTQFAADAILALEEPQAALLALRLRVLAFEQSETTKLLGEDAWAGSSQTARPDPASAEPGRAVCGRETGYQRPT
jgi:hypothetical protein